MFFSLQPKEVQDESTRLVNGDLISYNQIIISENQYSYWRFRKFLIYINNKKCTIIMGDEDEALKKEKDSIHRSELYLRTIIDYSESIMIILDKKCKIKNFLGSERIVNNPTVEFKTLIKEIISKESSQHLRNNIESVLSDGERLIQTKNVLCEGQEYTFKDIYYPIEGPSGNIEEIGIVREDISVSREIQEAYKAIVNNTTIGLMIIQEDRIVFSNRILREITGYSVDQYEVRTIPQIIENVVPVLYREYVITSYISMLKSKKESFNLQFPINTKEEDLVWFELFANPIVYNGKKSMQVAVIDITAKIDAETTLQRNTHILNSTYEQVIYIDNQMNIQMVNRQTVLEFAKEYEDFINMPIVDLLSPELNRDIIIGAFNSCMKTGAPWRGERWIIYPSEGRFMEISLFPYFESNEMSANGVVVVLRDISEMINNELKMNDIAENERRKIAMELHDGLTHELLGVSINANLLHKNLLKTGYDLADKAKEIEETVNRAIISARKLSKGLSPVKEEKMDIYTLINELMEIVKNRYGIECKLKIDSGIEIIDERILENIYYIIDESITNSLKHSNVSIVYLNVRRRGLFYEFEIKDKGRGFDTGKRAFGMGLKYMNIRARTISGTIDIVSHPGQGTAVTLKIKS
jgi:PAS domain S-box-containing protein